MVTTPPICNRFGVLIGGIRLDWGECSSMIGCKCLIYWRARRDSNSRPRGS